MKPFAFALLIGHNIKIWRELRSLKQDYLARRLGISKSAMSNIENGKTEITLSRAKVISEIFEIGFEDILSDPMEKLSRPEKFQQ